MWPDDSHHGIWAAKPGVALWCSHYCLDIQHHHVASLVIAVELEGVHAVIYLASPVCAPLLLGLLVPEVLAAHLHGLVYEACFKMQMNMMRH